MLQGRHIGTTVEHGGGVDAVFQEVIHFGRALQNVIGKCEQFSVVRGADANSLLKSRPMSDRGEHQGAGHGDFYRTLRVARANRSQPGMRPGKKLASEARSNKRGNDLD